MTDEDIKAALDAIARLVYEQLNIIRTDRHERTSKVLAIEFVIPWSPLTFEQISEVAGAFMTPNITIETVCTSPGIDSTFGMKVTARAPGEVSQLIVEGTLEPMPVTEVLTQLVDELAPVAPDDCERDCGCGQPSAHEHDFEQPIQYDAAYPDGKL